MCQEIEQAHAKELNLELFIDDQSRLWGITVRTDALLKVSKMYTLSWLLSTVPRYSKKKWLAKEKATLAVILPYSLLQLYDSQWLTPYWDAKQISFVQDQELSFSDDTRFELKQPYVSADITPPGQAAMYQTRSKPYDYTNSGLLALGIILLELHLDKPLETANTTSSDDTFEKALKGLRSCFDDEMNRDYRNVISFCLLRTPLPPTGNCTFDDAIFRDWYYGHVITPLETILMTQYEISKNDLAAL